MTPEQKDLVQTSFEKVKLIADTAAALFYGRLFDLDPKPRTPVQKRLEGQGRKLMHRIDLVVKGLNHPAELLPLLHELGERRLDSATESGAAALLEVAENALFRQKEQTAAFVLMQYFGYLRRDGNAPPESDLSGYNFCLNKLEQFGGVFVAAEMVSSFIISTEYRQDSDNEPARRGALVGLLLEDRK